MLKKKQVWELLKTSTIFFWKDSNLNFCQKLLRCSGWWYLVFQSEYENFWYSEAMNNIDELLLEYSIRTYDVRRVDWNKHTCYFRFGRDWKKMKFICRLKIFFNMAATYSKLFCCVQWVHICLQIKNLLNIRWIDEIRVTCIRWATKGIMVDWAQRCSLKKLIFVPKTFLFKCRELLTYQKRKRWESRKFYQ